MAQALTLRKQVTDLLLPLCVAAMDACWIFTVTWIINAVLLTNPGRVPAALPDPLILGLLWLGAWRLTSTLLERTSLPMSVVQTATGMAGLIACFGISLLITYPPDGINAAWIASVSLGVSMSFVLWFMGSLNASERINFTAVYSRFRLGLVVMGVVTTLAVIVGGARLASLWVGLGSVPIWFFIWSLVGLGLGNRETARSEGATGGGVLWGTTLAFSLLSVLLIGSTLGVFGGVSIIDIVQQLVGAILFVVLAIIYMGMYAFLWILGILFPMNDIRLGPTPTPTVTPTPGPNRPVSTARPIGSGGFESWLPRIPQEVLDAAVWVVAALALGAIVWLISRGLRRTRGLDLPEVREERESLDSWLMLQQQLKTMLGRLRGGDKAVDDPQEDELAWLRGRPEWSGTLAIRQIYTRLQSAAASIGYPRAPQQTPQEYFKVLSKALPSASNDLGYITKAYIEARYGPLPAPNSTARLANDAWLRVEPIIRRDAGLQ